VASTAPQPKEEGFSEEVPRLKEVVSSDRSLQKLPRLEVSSVVHPMPPNQLLGDCSATNLPRPSQPQEDSLEE
jgi:hypothetical protein